MQILGIVVLVIVFLAFVALIVGGCYVLAIRAMDDGAKGTD